VNTAFTMVPKLFPDFESTLVIKNLFNNKELYPINATGNLFGAEGTPAIESRSWWLEFNYHFN
uniref:hypothetical protein n=1 Tax=Aliikangiella sp. G2MR2-5 TaxID=2788943 RepID=UPI001AEDA8CD